MIKSSLRKHVLGYVGDKSLKRYTPAIVILSFEDVEQKHNLAPVNEIQPPEPSRWSLELMATEDKMIKSSLRKHLLGYVGDKSLKRYTPAIVILSFEDVEQKHNLAPVNEIQPPEPSPWCRYRAFFLWLEAVKNEKLKTLPIVASSFSVAN
ncbi:hypothetical protein [Parasitella parasitica]|uniref:Uncharacterized protein n=1 Tax=Parasitella parasitica TaxID=35722 RepID=A0A0B7NE38_9FUNG|nr:hypothetical protein [Parasitella parasitica]